MTVPRIIRRELEATGLPWEIKNGTRHHKIVLAGELVGILPGGVSRGDNSAGRGMVNVKLQIRRAARRIRNN